MRLKQKVVLALVAGCSIGSMAAAQQRTKVSPEPVGQVYKIDLNGHILGEMSPYEARAIGFAYRNNTFDSPTGGTSFSATHRCDLEDVSFTTGPWSTETTHSWSRVQFSLRRNGLVALPASGVFLVYRIWDSTSVNTAGQSGNGTTEIAAGATPLAQLTITLPTLNQDTIYGFAALDFDPISITPTGNNVYVEAKLITDTANDTLLTTDCWRLVLTTGTGAAFPANPATVGSTASSCTFDGIATPTYALDGIFQGGTPIGAPYEIRNIVFTTTPQQTVGLDFAMGGELPAVAPNCQAFTLGDDNVFASDTQSLAADGVKWYCMTLPSDATDLNLKYIDFDTEGSDVDAAIAVYKSDGTLVAFDDNSGSGSNAMLSFGIGRRAAVGDGMQYDGRNWDDTGAVRLQGLSFGDYYVAVAPSGAGSGATFADAFSAVGNGLAGNVTLRVRTNVAGGQIDPSVPPQATRVVGLGNEDPIIAPGGQLAPFALHGPGVYWSDVQLCQAADASNPVSFDGTGTTALQYSITLFDEIGNEVGSAAGDAVNAAVLNFGGGNAGLPAGHYYIAMTYDSPTPALAPSPMSDGRWHARGINGSQGYDFVIAVLVPWNACGASVCCRNDFNGDGDVGTDADITAFFACLSGDCTTCPPDADFNCDGDVGTDADITSFFSVLAGGSC